MRISGIIHQQICQIKWHLLACLGLIMVLPIEEAVVNLKEGDGFFSSNLVFPAVMFGILLAGLIACANVQGDLNEKRYIFWRSKPANVKLLITLKFFIGLIISLMLLACPVVFSIVSSILFAKNYIEPVLFGFSVALPILIAVMTYSLCFACNVVVRKTARAWLIGMLLAGFLLVLPFMLPLGYKDFVSDVMLRMLAPYMAIILALSAAAFVFALYAAQHDWHLRTNLKSLLWVGAGLVFVLLMLFSSQVANIDVLQEEPVKASSAGWHTLDNVAGRIVLGGRSYVDIDKNNISFSNIGGYLDGGPHDMLGIEGYRMNIYPNWWSGRLYKKSGDDLYSFPICAYYRREGKKNIYEKVYLRSLKFTGKSWTPVGELDISDCLTDNPIGRGWMRAAMRLIDNVVVVCVNSSCIAVDVTDPGELKRIDTKLDVLKTLRHWDRQKEFTVPLVPLDGISIQERIKLSIDLNYRFGYGSKNIYKGSIVDIDNDKIAFFTLSHRDVARFDVTRWDDEKIYCRFGASRPFTILEGVTGPPAPYDPKFVKNGKLYCYDNQTLLVFDIRSNRRIRKLGHFVRMSCSIEDVEVLDDGTMLLCAWRDKDFGRGGRYQQRMYLYLLENPQ